MCLPCWGGETLVGQKFGFSGPEIFPVDPQISQIRSGDLDGDGLLDLVVVNNTRSKINLLYNRTGKTNRAPAVVTGGRKDANELPPDARFKIESLASEKRIAALVVEDFNGDGRPDLAYYGEPKELVLHLNQGTNGWGTPQRWPIDDGQLSPNGMGSGDLNGDERADLVLLAEDHLYILWQEKEGGLAEPIRLPFSGNVKSVQIVDVDGDQANDLLLVNWEDRNPFRVRLQQKGGEFGPEFYFPMAPIRSYWADELVEKAKVQIMSIAQNSGRAQVSEFTKQPAKELVGNFSQGQFSVLPLARTDKASRGLVWTDVNGDDRADLLAAEPENGQIAIFLQKEDGTLEPAKTFPTFAGVSDIAVADWNKDGQQEIFLLSRDERQVGVTTLDKQGRLPFPSLIAVEGRPLVLDTAPLRPGKSPVLAMVVDVDGRRSLVLRSAEGETRIQKLNENYRANPTTLSFHDANQDGLPDLVLLTPYEKVKVLLQVPDKDFEEIDLAPPGGVLEQPWLSSADVDGDGKEELLLTQKNFLRAVVLQSERSMANSTNRGGWTFTVKEQINGSAANSRLAGAAALQNGDNRPALFLLDAERKAITLCQRDTNAVWQVVRNIPLPYSSFSGLQPVALGGKKANAIACFGLDAVGWLRLDGETWELTPLDGYETTIKDAHLNDVVTGDLDNDGRKDLVFLETAKNYLDVVTFDAGKKLIPADRWQVFEERTFRSRRNDLPEPREALVADLDKDGRNDLAVVVHDRVLIYLQE